MLKKRDHKIFEIIEKEKARQLSHLELIASENFVSSDVLEAAGSILTNKYAEGYPHKRYYGGCQFADEAEELAISRAKEIFGADHVNVQPHSGSQANIAVLISILQPGDKVLGMKLDQGGHLTHGHPLNFSGLTYNFISYGIDPTTELIDYDALEKQAITEQPKLIIAGASAYSRTIDFQRIGEIARKVGAYYMVDMAHIAGLVAAGLHNNPVPYADFVTTTTHKTLRGPRGGMILCRSEFAKQVDRAIFPATQGGPLMHIIAAKAVAFGEVLLPNFKTYSQQIIDNAQQLANELKKLGFKIVSGGTDNHLFLVDLRSFNITGKDAQNLLDKIHITVNKNSIPFDPASPMVTSGIRIGTPAITSRGLVATDMVKIAT